MISLVLGGTRSGKSEVAERLAQRRSLGPPRLPVTFVATAAAGGGDAGLDERIARHRARRPPEWATVEVAPGGGLEAPLSAGGVCLVDSLGTWVAGHGGVDPPLDGLLAALERRRSAGRPTVLVSDEVGLGVHPVSPAGLAFRDALGAVNRAVAEVADDVRLVVAGRVLVLSPEAP